VVADSTLIHTQLLADAMRTDHGLQVVAPASSSRNGCRCRARARRCCRDQLQL
jgi:hypothetical protein